MEFLKISLKLIINLHIVVFYISINKMAGEVVSAVIGPIKDEFTNTIDSHLSSRSESPELDLYSGDIKPGEPTKINNGWDDKKENIIKRWIEENKVYSWLLNQEFIRYNVLDQWLTIPIIILLTCSGIASLSSGSYSETTVRNFSLVAGIVQMLIGGLIAAKHVYNFGKKAQIFQLTSKKYVTMNNDFIEIMAENVNERVNGTIYIREKNKERNDLFENTPTVSDKTWIKFKKQLEEGNLVDLESSVLFKQQILTKDNQSDIIETKQIEGEDTVITIKTDKLEDKQRDAIISQIQGNINKSLYQLDKMPELGINRI